jgi:hypothetical protein
MLDQLRAMGVFACVVEKVHLAVLLENWELQQAQSVNKSVL